MAVNPRPPSNALLPLLRAVLFQHAESVNVETISGTKTLTVKSEQFQVLNGGVANRNVDCPAPSLPDTMGHFYVVYNAGSTNSLAVRTSAGTTLATLLPAQGCMVVHGPANYVAVMKYGAGAGGTDFGAPGLLTDQIGESTGAAMITMLHRVLLAAGALVKDSQVFRWGDDSDILETHATDSVRVTNAAAGTYSYDDDVLNINDPADATKRARFDAGEVTAGQLRVVTVPDQNVGSDQWIQKASGTISAAALRTLNATPVSMVAAPGATKYIKPLWVHWFLDYGGVQMDAAAAGDTLVARYTDGSGAAVVDAVAGDTIGGAVADYHTTVLAVAEVVPVVNAAIVAHINTGEWYAAAGTSELKFLIYYQVVTLPT